MKKNIFIALYIIGASLFNSCKNEVTEEKKESKNNLKQEKSDFYNLNLKNKKVKSKKSIAVQYKFGEPSDERLHIYTTIYNEEGYLVDSIIFKNNVRIAKESFEYNQDNELIKRALYDSSEHLINLLEREIDDNGNELGFKAFKLDTLRYSQKMTYNKDDQLEKITDYYSDGGIKNVSKFSYNSNGDIISKIDMNDLGVILLRQNISYDSEGRKVSETDYDSTGLLLGKTLIKNYDDDDNIQLIEKYNSSDSLYARYEFEYNEEGKETKNTIYNGLNQILRQSITSFDDKGNKVSFKIYEGERGLLGTDFYKYNGEGQEVETKVLNNQNEQELRKVNVYNEKGLICKKINYDKLDEPQFELIYEYTYFE